MRTVTVKKEDLLKILKENRDNHRAIFEEAQKNYRERAIEELDRRLRDAEEGRRIDVAIYLPAPEDHTKDYDRVIRMVEMSIEDNVELTNQEFAQYVQDDWSWRRAWVANTASYTASYLAEAEKVN